MNRKEWQAALSGACAKKKFTYEQLVAVKVLVDYAIQHDMADGLKKHRGFVGWCNRNRDVILASMPKPEPKQPEKQRDYIVTWSIDVTAASPYEAAKHAWTRHFEREWPPGEDSACVFYVNEAGKSEHARVKIDLERDTK